MSRSPTKGALTGALLVEAAGRLIDSGGISALTLRAVAGAVGISHNAPYRHFADKRTLLAAVAVSGFRELRSELERAAADAPDAWAALRATTAAYFAFARRRPALYRLLFSAPELTAEPDLEVERAAMEMFGFAAGIVAGAQAKSGSPQIDIVQLTGLVYALLHGLAEIELSGRAREAKGLHPIEQIANLQLDILRKVLSAPTG